MRLRDRVEKLKAENEELESKVHELNELIEHKDGEIIVSTEHIENLESNIGELNEAIEEHESTIESLESNIGELNDAIEEHESTIESLESNIVELNDAIEEHESTIESLESNIVELNDANVLQGDFELLELRLEYLTNDSFRLALEDAFLAAHTGNTPLAIKHIRSIFEGLNLTLPMMQLEEIKRTGGF